MAGLASLTLDLDACRALLAGCRLGSGGGDEHDLDPATEVAFTILSIFLVLFAGLMAGLTLGLLSLDRVDLEVIKRSGSPREVWLAERVEPVLARPHFLLATLLLCNSVAMEALPLFLDRLLNPVAAIVISVSAILLFGEIIPQAVCKRYGLQVGAYMAWFVRFLMLLTAPLTWPIGKLLDWILGEESALFKRRELKALVSIHAEPEEEGEESTLTRDEVQVIQGALDMASKTAESAMTPVDKVFMLSSEAEVNDSLLLQILQRGHSRLPVYEGENKQNIVGIVLVKELLLVDEDSGVRIRDLRLRELPFMSSDTMLYDVLKVFRYGRSHMSCVTRPSPATGRLDVVGIITIEDVLEELLQQEIVDETDQYVDNLQTVKTTTLESLQTLPPNLRRLLTRSMFQHAPAASHGALPRVSTSASMVAAAAGAVAGASVSDAPHSPGAVAAAAATTALLVARRGAGGSNPALGPQAPAGGQGRSLSPFKPERAPAAPGGSSYPPSGGSVGGLSSLLAQDKPPVPLRTSSSRSLRGWPADMHRQGSDALRASLMESEHEGEGGGSPWAAGPHPPRYSHETGGGGGGGDGLDALFQERRRQHIADMLSPDRQQGGAQPGGQRQAGGAPPLPPRRVAWQDPPPPQASGTSPFGASLPRFPGQQMQRQDEEDVEAQR